MHLIDCQNKQQGDAILAIFNDAILHTTALYEYQPRDRQTIDRWFADKQQLNLPVIGALAEHGQLMGFASYGRFRPFPAFNTTVEHSIYLHPDYRGRGIGKVLLLALIERAQSQHYHCIIGAIDADNAASIALHQALGFQETGKLPQVGYKFDRWLDLVFYQKLL